MNKFAEIIKKRRLELRLSLRQFCLKCQFDPSNWSKIERGLASPPKDKSVLEKISDVLGYKPKSPESQNLMDSAFITCGKIPDDILSDKKLVAKLPIFFRSLRGDKHSDQELRNLVEIIRDSETKE